MSGMEVAGLALAILPLVIEAAKAYAHGAESIRQVISKEHRDNRLQEFYEEFWWQTSFINRTLRNLVSSLPLLCDDCKATLLKDFALEEWETNAVVEAALLNHFGSEKELDDFILVMKKILTLMNSMIDVKASNLDPGDKDPERMYRRLRSFCQHRKSGKNKSSVVERIRFFKTEKNRTVCTKNLQIWNDRLLFLCREAGSRRASDEDTEFESGHRLPAVGGFFNVLFSTIRDHWDCNCNTRHEAMLCLKIPLTGFRQRNLIELEFELLLPGKPQRGSSTACWLEGKVLVQNGSPQRTKIDEKRKLAKICEVLQPLDSALRFLIETQSDQRSLWQLRSQAKKFKFLNTTPRKSLMESITSNQLSRLRVKRRLALTLACALIQCGSSPCSRYLLQRDSIFFCTSTGQEHDFDRPYLSTQFEDHMSEPVAADMAVQHRCHTVLQLGILLLEIHKGQQFLSYWTPEELASSSPNTELIVARRLLNTLEEWCERYKAAVSACLDITWVPTGRAVDLSDPHTSVNYYNAIVKPLEEEVKWFFSTNFA